MDPAVSLVTVTAAIAMKFACRDSGILVSATFCTASYKQSPYVVTLLIYITADMMRNLKGEQIEPYAPIESCGG